MAVIGTVENEKIIERVKAELEFKTGAKIKKRAFTEWYQSQFQYNSDDSNKAFVDGWLQFEKEAKGWYEVSERMIELYLEQKGGN